MKSKLSIQMFLYKKNDIVKTISHFFYLFYSNFYLAILGGSLKKIAKKITIRVPTNKNTYTNASMFLPFELILLMIL